MSKYGSGHFRLKLYLLFVGLNIALTFCLPAVFYAPKGTALKQYKRIGGVFLFIRLRIYTIRFNCCQGKICIFFNRAHIIFGERKQGR